MIKFLYIKKQKKFILLYNKQQRGFSLIEMMIVVGVLGLITLGLVTFFMGGTKSWVAGQSQLEAQRNARQAMDRMVREIREGKKLLSSSDRDTIIINFPSSFGKNDVTYQLNGIIIDREVNSTSNPVIDNVQSLAFNYFDSSDLEVTLPLTVETASKISKVHIDLQVDVDDDGNSDITLNTDVNLRNFSL